MREVAADRAGFGRHRNGLQSHAREGPQVRDEHAVIRSTRPFLRQVEGVGILHQEFAAAHDAEPRPDLVPELPLNMIEDARQILVGLDPVAEDRGDQLLVGGPVEHVALVPVLNAQHLLAVIVVASTFAPQVGGLDRRHQEFQCPGPILFLADDLLDLTQDPMSQRQPAVDAGARLTDHTGAKH